MDTKASTGIKIILIVDEP